MPVTALRPLRTAAALRPLHVVQVSRDAALFDPERGAESRARQRAHARTLAACRPGSRMTIVVVTSDRLSAPLEEQGLAVHAVAGPGRRSLGLWRALDRLHRTRPIDVITTQTVSEEAWTVLLLARWRSIRVVGQVHNDLLGAEAATLWRPRWLRALRRRLALRSLRYFHSLRVVSKPLERQLYARRLHGRISTIPVVMPALAEEAPTSPTSEPRSTVLFVGRLAPDKDLERWLAVAARVAPAAPTSRFEIVGEGPDTGRLRARAHALGIADRVRFRGFIPNAALASVYRNAAVLVVTSPSEGFGRVIAEALAHGTPVVATRSTGPEELLRHPEAGFLHDRDDIDGMAGSVLRLLHDRALRTRMGRAGALRVRHAYDPARLRRAWIAMLVGAARPPLGPLRLPRRRTFTRWREIAFSRYSLLRTLEYEALRGLTLRGRVLDIGGGGRNSYHHLLRVEGEIESVNIDAGVTPTHRHDLNEPLPLPEASYDHVLSLNTFEHLYRDDVAVSEALRVLKPGGSFHFVVPFLYRVHGSPLDFSRHTAEWWMRALEEQGVDTDRLTIEPLVWDRVGSAFSFFGSGTLGRCARPMLLLPAVLRDLWGRGERLRDRGSSRRVAEYALGYFISGTK